MLAGRMDNSCETSSVAEIVHRSNEDYSVERVADAGDADCGSIDDDLDSVPDEVDSTGDESDSDLSKNGDAAPQSVRWQREGRGFDPTLLQRRFEKSLQNAFGRTCAIPVVMS